MIFNFLRFIVYERHCRLNINEIYKNYCFKHRVAVHATLKSVFLFDRERFKSHYLKFKSCESRQ